MYINVDNMTEMMVDFDAQPGLGALAPPGTPPVLPPTPVAAGY